MDTIAKVIVLGHKFQFSSVSTTLSSQGEWLHCTWISAAVDIFNRICFAYDLPENGGH
jgi:hypothetical protein